MVEPIFRFLFGNVKFEIKGEDKEDFLNGCRKNNIRLFGINNLSGKLYAKTYVSTYLKLRKQARESGVVLRIKKKRGLPFLIKPIKKRPGIPVGIVIMSAMMIILSLFVWDVKVDGGENISGDLFKQITKLGARPGVLKNDLNYRRMEQIIMRDNSNLSWVGISTLGSRLVLKVSQRTEPPGKEDRDSVSNIVASRDGIISSVSATAGQKMVGEGTAVTKGELLISGIVEDEKTGVTLYKKATGTVYAMTIHQITTSMPMDREVEIESEKKTLAYIKILGIELPTGFGGIDEDDRIDLETIEPVYIIGHETGICMRRVSITKVKKALINHTQDETVERLRIENHEKLLEEMGAGRVTSKEEHIECDGKNVVLTTNYSCIEEIGTSVNIETKN